MPIPLPGEPNPENPIIYTPEPVNSKPTTPTVDPNKPTASPTDPSAPKPYNKPSIRLTNNPVPIKSGQSNERLLYDKLAFNDTKFKTLKYGNGINSANYDEPILITPIKNDNSQGRQYSFSEFAREHQYRVSELLKLPRGIKFISNQEELDRLNVPLEKFKGTLRPTRTYRPENLKLQLEGEEGSHIPRNFNEGSYLGETSLDRVYKYSTLVTQNNQSGNNRLETIFNNFDLKAEKTQANIKFIRNSYQLVSNFTSNIIGGLGSILSNTSTLFNDFTQWINAGRALNNQSSPEYLDKINSFLQGANSDYTNVLAKINKINSYLSFSKAQEIDRYSNGPSSNFSTVISRTVNTKDFAAIDKIKKLVENKLNEQKDRLNVRPDLTPLSLIVPGPGTPDPTTGPTAGFAQKSFIDQSVYSVSSAAIDPKDNIQKTRSQNIFATNQNVESRKHITFNTDSYTYKKVEPISVLNNDITSPQKPSIKWIRSKGSNNVQISNGKVDAYTDKDIDSRSDIVFALSRPFGGEKPEDIMLFSGYLGRFGDTIRPIWNTTSYIGRSDNFYIYNSFTRSVTFDFKIPSYNQKELNANHNKLAKLLASTMGEYKENKLGGIIHQVTLGRYLSDQPSVITNIDYSILSEDPWDIDEGFSQVIYVTVNLDLIHGYLPTYTNADKIFRENANATVIKSKKDGVNVTAVENIQNVLNNKGGSVLADNFVKDSINNYASNLLSPLAGKLGFGSNFKIFG